MSSESSGKLHLLLFNIATDADHPVQGFTTSWINALAEHCEQIDVVSMWTGRLAVADNVHVYSIGKERGYSEPRRAVEFYRILLRLLREWKYDACFAHMNPLFAVMSAPLLKARRIPITLWYAHKSVTLMLRLAEKLVDRVVTPSPESFRIDSPKKFVIGHGIDTEVFMPAQAPRPDSRPFVVVSVGRIAPIKNLEMLIEATQMLVYGHGMKSLRVRLVGNVYPHDVAYAETLQEKTATYGLESFVEFAGPVVHDEIAREYQRADVAVNLSRTGSIDKAVLEAMSCGVLVITSNEAFRQILSPWSDTVLITDSTPGDLALGLKKIALIEQGDRQALGRQLREVVVEGHSLDVLAETLVENFEARTR